MIDNEKQKAFLEAMLAAMTKGAPQQDALDKASAELFKLFQSMVRCGFTEEQAILFLGTLLGTTSR